MSDTEALLFANEAFYRAFADRDIEAMADIWSRAHPVSCLHPGWGPLFERSEVMSSWAAILSSSESPDIRCQRPQARVCRDVGIVVCFERLHDALLVATNVFVREGSLWKMVHHQGGLSSVDAPPEEAPAERAVH